MSEVFFPQGKKVMIAGEEITIMPFVLRNRVKVLRIIADVCVDLGASNPNMKPSDFPRMTSMLITAAGDKLTDIYELALGKPREWLEENVTLKDEVIIIEAISEVNDLPFLFSQVKNLIANVKVKKTA